MHPKETPPKHDQASAQVMPISKAVQAPDPAAGSPPPEEEASKVPRRLVLGGGLLTVLTAAAVLHGWLYHVGYLSAFNIPAEMFPEDVRSLLLNDYFMGWSVSGKAATSLTAQTTHLAEFAALFGCVIGLGFAAMYWLDGRSTAVQRAREVAKAKLKHPGTFSAAFGTLVAGGLFILPFGVVFVAITLLAVPLISVDAGRSEANHLLAIRSCYDDRKNLAKGCVEATFKGGNHAVGIYIASNEKALALRIEGESLIYYEPLTSIRTGSAAAPK
jgi:hypothetical protein